MTRLRTECTTACSATACAPARPSSTAGSSQPARRCAYFQTGPEFVPVLLRQRDHAREHGQTDRAQLFEGLVNRATEESA